MNIPGINEIYEAAERINNYIHQTPVLTSELLNKMVDAEIFFKCENFQKVGAFKFRGATNTVFSLSNDEAKHGVTTHSSGNHAAALTLAAKMRGITAYIVMPVTAPEIKKTAVRDYGAQITFCKATLQSREETLEKVVERTGAVFVHPYNDLRVICGQGTAALELIQEVPELDIVMAPVGGGGLLSGTCITVSNLSANTKIIGAEPEGADDAYRSLKEGRIIPSVNPETIADGLLTSLKENTFNIIRKYADQIITVSDNATINAMRFIWERMKIIVEPSAAVPFGAVLEKKISFSGKRIGIILSGGNVDLVKLPWLT
jgi:threonine dehydratase